VCFPRRDLGSLATVSRTSKRLKVLGESIRRHRKQANLSQERLAEKAELHPVYLGKIERGEKWISLHALLRIADALRVQVAELVGEL
jgi:transcriptional regulator with XRE-family HTH domain